MLVAGTKGFAIQLVDVLNQLNYQNKICFFDNINKDLPARFLNEYPIIDSIEAAKQYFEEIDNIFALGLGGPKNREMVFNLFHRLGGTPLSVISPFSIIGKHEVTIGVGSTILSNAIIESTSSIGIGCLINLQAAITHNCTIGDFCEICPNAVILGNCSIGSYTFIGTGAIILPNLTIGKNVIVGAGAVITENIPDNTTVVGIPGKIIKS